MYSQAWPGTIVLHYDVIRSFSRFDQKSDWPCNVKLEKILNYHTVPTLIGTDVLSIWVQLFLPRLYRVGVDISEFNNVFDPKIDNSAPLTMTKSSWRCSVEWLRDLSSGLHHHNLSWFSCKGHMVHKGINLNYI